MYKTSIRNGSGKTSGNRNPWGTETARVEDTMYARGHIALQAMSDAVTGVTTVIQFRKLEIREFAPAGGRARADRDQGFVPHRSPDVPARRRKTGSGRIVGGDATPPGPVLRRHLMG